MIHKIQFVRLMIVAVTLHVSMLRAESAHPTAAEVTRTVQKALPLIEKSSAEYLEHRECFSCHHQAMPVLTLTEAKARGFVINDENYRQQLERTAKHLSRGRDNYLRGKGQGGRVDTAGYALWALSVGDWESDDTTSAVTEYLLSEDMDLDHWKRSGTRPPSEASDITATAVAVLGLRSFGTSQQDDRIATKTEKVGSWIMNVDVQDTEDRVFRLHTLRYLDEDGDMAKDAVVELVKTQRDDGGWSQNAELDSDAYATGSTLVALHQAGKLPVSDPVYQLGLRFLIDSQRDDGSWHVRSRSKPFQKYFESGFPHGKDQFISMSATCWATLALILACPLPQHDDVAATLRPVVEIEENVYSYEPPDNGSGPFWCSGSTCLVRIGEDVFASGIETLKDIKPLNNCRWTLYHRGPEGWTIRQVDKVDRTREPSPIIGFADGRLLLSANPGLVSGPQASGGSPARPEILEFLAAQRQGGFETVSPVWDGTPMFTEHSYRSFAADGPNSELILLQNVGYTHAEWTFRDRTGKWAASGKLRWPWGAEYDNPQPIRVCYPNVALKDRAVYFCGVSDIVEPYREWRAYKKQLTGRDWDYDFRRLFFTWSADITTGKFEPWVEIASRDQTAGWISPGDLWVAADGAVHLLWTERAVDTRLRDKFFPGTKQTYSLNHAVVRDGRVVGRRPLVLTGEGLSNEVPGRGRFHIASDNRMFVFYHVSGTDSSGKAVSENRLMELYSDGTNSEQMTLPMKHPLTEYFTATIRGGSLPSRTLDLLGQRVSSPTNVSYARLRLW